MSFLDRLLGRHRAPSAHRAASRWPPPQEDLPREPQGTPAARDADAQALERYQYLVRTAPPQALEQIHREAFARLTPEQRRRALYELNASVPPAERLDREDPAALARLATRAELMRPGTVVSAFGGAGLGGIGMGGLLAGGLLTSFVGGAMGSMLAHQLMGGFHGGHGFEHGFAEGYEQGHDAGQEAAADVPGEADAGGLEGADAGDVTPADWGGGDDLGGVDDLGGDLGGGFDDSVV